MANVAKAMEIDFQNNINKKAKKIYKEAEKKFGKRLQMIVAAEEMSELQKVIFKLLRNGIDGENLKLYEYSLCEEIADVLITVEQLILMFNLKDKVKLVKNNKLERLSKLIQES